MNKTEYLVIESSRKNGVFSTEEENRPSGYIPRKIAEQLLARDLGGTQWFSAEESERMRNHPAFLATLPLPHEGVPIWDREDCPKCGYMYEMGAVDANNNQPLLDQFSGLPEGDWHPITAMVRRHQGGIDISNVCAVAKE